MTAFVVVFSASSLPAASTLDLEHLQKWMSEHIDDSVTPCGGKPDCICHDFALKKPLPMDLDLRYVRAEHCPVEGLDGEAYWLRTYRSDGTVVDQGLMVDGKFQGTWNEWYANGQLEGEAHFDMGKQVGLQRSWHENGQLRWEERYVDGVEEGIWRRWTADGVLELELEWSKGEVVSNTCYVEDLCE